MYGRTDAYSCYALCTNLCILPMISIYILLIMYYVIIVLSQVSDMNKTNQKKTRPSQKHQNLLYSYS